MSTTRRRPGGRLTASGPHASRLRTPEPPSNNSRSTPSASAPRAAVEQQPPHTLHASAPGAAVEQRPPHTLDAFVSPRRHRVTAAAHASALRVPELWSHRWPGPQKASTCARTVEFTTIEAHIDGLRASSVAMTTVGAHGRPACAPTVRPQGMDSIAPACRKGRLQSGRRIGGRRCCICAAEPGRPSRGGRAGAAEPGRPSRGGRAGAAEPGRPSRGGRAGAAEPGSQAGPGGRAGAAGSGRPGQAGRAGAAAGSGRPDRAVGSAHRSLSPTDVTAVEQPARTSDYQRTRASVPPTR
jgi:hypothetical protein